MKPRCMLDTDTCRYLIRGESDRLRRSVLRHADELCVSAVTAAELRYGARKRGSRKLDEAVSALLALVEILPWTDCAADRYAQIRVDLEARGEPIGNMDQLIAASALAEGCRLITRNTEHFSRVPGLAVENWY